MTNQFSKLKTSNHRSKLRKYQKEQISSPNMYPDISQSKYIKLKRKRSFFLKAGKGQNQNKNTTQTRCLQRNDGQNEPQPAQLALPKRR